MRSVKFSDRANNECRYHRVFSGNRERVCEKSLIIICAVACMQVLAYVLHATPPEVEE